MTVWTAVNSTGIPELREQLITDMAGWGPWEDGVSPTQSPAGVVAGRRPSPMSLSRHPPSMPAWTASGLHGRSWSPRCPGHLVGYNNRGSGEGSVPRSRLGRGPAEWAVTLNGLCSELSWQTHRRRGAFRTKLLRAQVQPSQTWHGLQGSLLL